MYAELQPLCAPCHNVVKRALEHMYHRGEIKAEDLRMSSPIARRLVGQQLGCDEAEFPLAPDHPWRRTLNARKNR